MISRQVGPNLIMTIPIYINKLILTNQEINYSQSTLNPQGHSSSFILQQLPFPLLVKDPVTAVIAPDDRVLIEPVRLTTT